MHVTHLHENRQLTFGELKEVMALAASGQLEETSEKFDGMNLMFTWDGAVRVARGKGDIASGGLRAGDLKGKFAAYPHVLEAFLNGLKILDGAITALSDEVLSNVFQDGTIWYSLELIYPTVSNTINYDANSIVFHGWPVFTKRGGQIVKSDDDSGVDVLTSKIRQMQAAVSHTGWRIAGPSMVRLQGIADGSLAEQFFTQLDLLMSLAHATDESTIEDYLREMAYQEVRAVGIPEGMLAEAIAARLIKDPSAKTVVQLTKMAPKWATEIRQLVVNTDELLKKWIFPLETLISDFAIEVLRGLKSSLVADSDAEVNRLRARVNKAIEIIKSSNNEIALDVLTRQLAKLHDVENIASSAEGVVFIYKGNAYKFVGSFAPAHQILSLFRYGRPGAKFDVSDLDK